MRQEKAEAIVNVYLGPSAVCQRLKRFGFWKKPSEWKALVYVDEGAFNSDADRMLDKENWYLTRADLDTDV